MNQPLPLIISRRFVTEFRCAAGDCADTCCSGWPINVDKHTAKKYSRKHDLRNAMTDSPNGRVVCRDGNGTCVKFEDGLCGIQKKYGEEYLSDTCSFYPRSGRFFGRHLYLSATLSCPETAKNALFGDAPFAVSAGEIHREPPWKTDLLADEMDNATVHTITEAILARVQDSTHSAEKHMAALIGLADSLDELPLAAWQPAVQRHMESPVPLLVAAKSHPDDLALLLQAFLKILVSDEIQYRSRVYLTIRDAERALGITFNWETGDITSHDDGAAWRETTRIWQEQGGTMQETLRRWLGAQVCLWVYPFSGISTSAKRKTIAFALHFALVRLGLMAACRAQGGNLPQDEQIRVIQSIARTMDHLVEEEGFFELFPRKEWHDSARLRGLVGDT